MDNSKPCKTRKRPKTLYIFIYSCFLLTRGSVFHRFFSDISPPKKKLCSSKDGPWSCGYGDIAYAMRGAVFT